MPARVLRPQPDPVGAAGGETTERTDLANAAANKGVDQRLGLAGTDARTPCSFYWLASERAVWLEVGRHQPCPRDNERHTLNRLWSDWPLQDRIVTETYAGSANRFGCTREMERKLQIYALQYLSFHAHTPHHATPNLSTAN